MPKLKTKKAIAKRFKVTATGKIKYKKPGLRHCLGKKKTSAKAPLRHPGYLFSGDERLIVPGMPYGLK